MLVYHSVSNGQSCPQPTLTNYNAPWPRGQKNSTARTQSLFFAHPIEPSTSTKLEHSPAVIHVIPDEIGIYIYIYLDPTKYMHRLHRYMNHSMPLCMFFELLNTVELWTVITWATPRRPWRPCWLYQGFGVKVIHLPDQSFQILLLQLWCN